jgi:hypothetical protein
MVIAGHCSLMFEFNEKSFLIVGNKNILQGIFILKRHQRY